MSSGWPPFLRQQQCTHAECVIHLELMTKSLGRATHVYATDTFHRAVHALTHSSPNLFYPVVGKPIMPNNYSFVKLAPYVNSYVQPSVRSPSVT